MSKTFKEIINGNLHNEPEIMTPREGGGYEGWFFGHFIKEGSKFSQCHTKDFEIKWGVHPKGKQKKRPGYNKKARTFTILIHGKFLVTFFRDNKKEEFLLEKAGDYILYPPKISHTWLAKEDSLTFTIRWPSVPNDQKRVSKKLISICDGGGLDRGF